jgi:carotenoid cleavage dioxygenase
MEYGPLKGPFTAHPKTDPRTGELLFFGYNADGKLTPGVQVGAIDAQGRLTHYARLQAPYPSMIHDFMATPGHLLIPVLPLTGSLARGARRPWLCMGAREARHDRHPAAWWRRRRRAVVRGPRLLRVPCDERVGGRRRGTTHSGGRHGLRRTTLFPHADGSPGDPARQQAYLTRWTFDLASDIRRFTAERLDGGEFHASTTAFRASAIVTDGSPRRIPSTAKARQRHHAPGHADGTRDAYWLPPGDITSEPVFARVVALMAALRAAKAMAGCWRWCGGLRHNAANYGVRCAASRAVRWQPSSAAARAVRLPWLGKRIARGMNEGGTKQNGGRKGGTRRWRVARPSPPDNGITATCAPR